MNILNDRELRKRDSNIELFRVLMMLLIISHHYVVNSGIYTQLFEERSLGWFHQFYLFIFGAWGKTGINCFILITGYFGWKNKLYIKKWLGLYLQFIFFNLLIYIIFIKFGFDSFSIDEFKRKVFPFFSKNDSYFTTCYLLFFFLTPYINILISNIDKKTHKKLILTLLIVFSFLPSIPGIILNTNYVCWFVVVYIIGAYIGKYNSDFLICSTPPHTKIQEHDTNMQVCFDDKVPKLNNGNRLSVRLWMLMLVNGLIMLIAVSISFINYKYYNKNYYFLLADSNAINAVVVSVSLLILFINLPIKYNKFINILGASVFGVLCIHANSGTMRNVLWKIFLQNEKFSTTKWIYFHSIFSVLGVFIICVLIDQMRKILFDRVIYLIRYCLKR